MKSQRTLRTILFTDLVGSTERAVQLGDRAWRELQARHHTIVRRCLRRWGAREITEAGDGFLAVLASPARGVLCAAEIRDTVQSLDLQVRCGIHMGEVEDAAGGSVGGIGVHIGARVAALAAAGEILVSRAVRDAEQGSGFAFEERGAYELKGIPGEWHLYRVAALPEHGASMVPGRGERTASALRGRTGVLLAAAAVAVMGILAAGLALREDGVSGPDGESPATVATTADLFPSIDRSIAVLPFDNLSSDPEDAYFADGITDDILAALSKLDDLRVISRTSVLQYRGSPKPVRQIGAELGVGTVLEGTVRRAEDRVRITVQLIDARTDEHVWSEQYDRELTDIFAIQTEIAEAIAARLHAQLAAEERQRIEAGQTRDPEAYLLVLKARERMIRSTSRLETYDAEMQAAIGLLRGAIARDPNYARAHADLASAYFGLSIFQGGSWADSSEAAANRAVAHAPNLAHGYRALGIADLATGRLSDAIENYRRAVELDPNYVDAVGGLGRGLQMKGRLGEALRQALKLVSLEPTNSGTYVWVGGIYEQLGMLDEAEAWFVRAIELAPENGSAYAALALLHFRRGDRTAAHASLDKALEWSPSAGQVLDTEGTIAMLEGDWERVRSSAERMYAVGGNIKVLAVYLGYAHERLGNATRAVPLYAEAEGSAREQVAGSEDPLPFYTLAALSAVRGEDAAALDWLNEAFERGYRFHWLLTVDPLFDGVRDDPRFAGIMNRIEADLASMRELVRRQGLVRRP